jgi:hypothetical protein
LAQCAHPLKAVHCCKIWWSKVVLHLKSKKRSFAYITSQRLMGLFFHKICRYPPTQDIQKIWQVTNWTLQFKALMQVNIKDYGLLDVTLCSLIDRYQHFGETGYVHLQENTRLQVPPKRWYISKNLDGITIQILILNCTLNFCEDIFLLRPILLKLITLTFP